MYERVAFISNLVAKTNHIVTQKEKAEAAITSEYDVTTATAAEEDLSSNSHSSSSSKIPSSKQQHLQFVSSSATASPFLSPTRVGSTSVDSPLILVRLLKVLIFLKKILQVYFGIFFCGYLVMGVENNDVVNNSKGNLPHNDLVKNSEGNLPHNDAVNNNEGNLPHNDVVNNNEGDLPQEVKKILHDLASKWDDVVDSSALQVFPLKGAMTNAVFEVNWSTKKGILPRKVLVRIYGEGVGVFFDRKDEIATFECMSKHGQGPHLLKRFENGRVEEFIHARTLSAPDLRNPEISALIATKLREFHDLHMPAPRNVVMWDRLRKWFIETKQLCSTDEAQSFRLDAIEAEISILEKKLSRDDEPVGFCHNDLQYGNIMFEEDTAAVTIIDYEYACFNPVAFDIANHFCEMAADYHTETPHLLNYDNYPDLEERQRFAHIYLKSSGTEPSKGEVQQLVQDAEKYTLASHLMWGLWGIISEKVNEIDFDYMEYARQRFQQYWATKALLLEDKKALGGVAVS